MEAVSQEFIKVIPSILWFILVASIVIYMFKPIRYELLPRLRGIETAGVKFSFIRKSIDSAITLAKKSSQWEIDVSNQEKIIAEHRAQANIIVFSSAFVLWLDDHPENNVNERKMFKHLGVEIDIARDTDEALRMVENGSYDIVFSDMMRENDPESGIKFANNLVKAASSPPLIFYVGVLDDEKPVPKNAFAITNKPNELLHCALDVLERSKY